ncbi:T-box transcription factor TBX6L isoform X1, partial [Silurus asotus]
MYVHEDYPYPHNPLTKSYGYYPQGQMNPVCRVSGGEAELMSLPVHAALQGRDLWDKFNNVGTEMLITKMGRALPLLSSVICTSNGLKTSQDHWEVSGKSEPHLPNCFFIHPDSPALGERWMQYPISFHKLKLTNNTLNSKGLQVVLHSMHKYQPRLHIVQAPDPCGGHNGGYLRFTFPEAAFIAVTSYQNQEVNTFVQPKIIYAYFQGVCFVKKKHCLSVTTRLLNMDDEEEEQEVSSSVDSSGALCVPEVRTPSAPVSNPFLPAFLKCGLACGQEGINQSPISHHCQHNFHSENSDSRRSEDNLQYKCVSFPEGHATQNPTPQHPLCHGPDIQTPAVHQIYSTHSKLNQSLHLPPKLSRMQMPESVFKSLEFNPNPLSDIFNIIRPRALAKDSQINPQHNQTASGSNREAKALIFPAVQD